MKKITKILLPIASTVAVASPMVCLASCASGHYESEKYVNILEGIADSVSCTFKAKEGKIDSSLKISAQVVGVTLPHGLVFGSLFAVSIIPSPESILITIANIDVLDDQLPEGSTINVHLRITATSGDESVKGWTEKNSTFKIVHSTKV